MKKILLSLVALVALTSLANAQVYEDTYYAPARTTDAYAPRTRTVAAREYQERRLHLGPKVGLNITGLTNLDNSSSRYGLNAGGFIQYRFNDLIAIQPEVLFSMQGGESKNDEEKYTVRLNYLNIPVLAKIYFLRSGLNVEIGPQLGLRLNSKLKHHGDNNTTKLHGYHDADFGIVFGLGYDIDRFTISARYNMGLTKVTGDNSAKNKVFQFSVGWKIF